MNRLRLLLAFVLADFLALNAYVVYQYGFVGFLQLVMANAATVAAFVDLTIALVLIAVWMWRDARSRGVSPFPYLVATALLGSAGPLLYLIRRPETSRAV